MYFGFSLCMFVIGILMAKNDMDSIAIMGAFIASALFAIADSTEGIKKS